MHKQKRKEFYERRCRKKAQRRCRKNRKRKILKHLVKASKQTRYKYFTLRAPKVLSVFEDTENTVSFFSSVLDTVQRCTFKSTLYFDLSMVEEITPDAIMYLISLIKNLRRIRTLQVKCMGNFPKNKEAKKMIIESGFYDFMGSSYSKKVKFNKKHMQICSGMHADGKLASSICDFVIVTYQVNRKRTKRLYPIIIELMTNTYQHAYELETKSLMINYWYIFAEAKNGYVHFVFLDTGVGIPRTIYRKLKEKIKDFLYSDESLYLKSVLEGEFRSETKQENRGKGLPGIYEDIQNNEIQNLNIISCKGKCYVDSKSKRIETKRLDNSFEGTLFSWDIKIENETK